MNSQNISETSSQPYLRIDSTTTASAGISTIPANPVDPPASTLNASNGRPAPPMANSIFNTEAQRPFVSTTTFGDPNPPHLLTLNGLLAPFTELGDYHVRNIWNNTSSEPNPVFDANYSTLSNLVGQLGAIQNLAVVNLEGLIRQLINDQKAHMSLATQAAANTQTHHGLISYLVTQVGNNGQSIHSTVQLLSTILQLLMKLSHKLDDIRSQMQANTKHHFGNAQGPNNRPGNNNGLGFDSASTPRL